MDRETFLLTNPLPDFFAWILIRIRLRDMADSDMCLKLRSWFISVTFQSYLGVSRNNINKLFFDILDLF